MTAEDKIDALVRRVESLEARLGVPQPEILLTAGEVAGRLRCGVTNVYDLIASGDLEAVRTGAGKKGYRVSGPALRAFLERRSAPTPTPTPHRVASRHFPD